MEKILLLMMLLLSFASQSWAVVTGTTFTQHFTCSGSGTAFPFTFAVYDYRSLMVQVSVGGGTTILTPTTQYTATAPLYQSGGTVTLVSASSCPAGATLDIIRVTPETQNSVYKNSQTLDQKILMHDLDKIWMAFQEADANTVRMPIGLVNGDRQLPAAPPPNSLIAWNATGTGFQYLLTTPSAYISTTVSASTYGPDISDSIAAIGSANVTLVIDSPITCLNNSTVPANINLVAQPPGLVTVSSGMTLTINGPFYAGICHVFEGTGAVIFGTKCDVHPEWWATNTNPGATNMAPAINAAAAAGGRVLFQAVTYKITAPISFTKKNSFIGSSFNDTIIKYTGTAGTFAFTMYFDPTPIPPAGMGDDQWPGRVRFEEMTIQGDGSTSKGTDATVGGISASNDDYEVYTLVNIPFFSLKRVQFSYCSTGLQIEGYGHTLDECYAWGCGIGYDFTHPEQVQVMGTWADHCGIGLQVNVRKVGPLTGTPPHHTTAAGYGHLMLIHGGAYQGCNKGIWICTFYEPDINTYFEQNSVCDIQFGDPLEAWSFAGAVKDVKLRMNTANSSVASGGTGGPSAANVDMYGTVVGDIEIYEYTGVSRATSYVRGNANSKYITVHYNVEAMVNSTNASPFDLPLHHGNVVLPQGSQLTVTPTLGTGYTSLVTAPPAFADAPLRYYKSDGFTLNIKGGFAVTSGYAGAIFTLPEKYIPQYKQTFLVPQYSGAECGWTIGVVEIRPDGNVLWMTPSDNSQVFLDSIVVQTYAFPEEHWGYTDY